MITKVTCSECKKKVEVFATEEIVSFTCSVCKTKKLTADMEYKEIEGVPLYDRGEAWRAVNYMKMNKKTEYKKTMTFMPGMKKKGIQYDK